jgi:ABC-type Fe3+ transport system substrate-binding protein
MNNNLLECTIREIVSKYPETEGIFNGFNIFTKEDLSQGLGDVLRLKTLLRIKKINPATFTRLLGDEIENTERNHRLSAVVINKPGVFNFVAQLPCALHLPLNYAFHDTLQRLQTEKNLQLNYYIWSCSNDILAFSDYLQHVQDIDNSPDLILTTDYNLFNKNFVRQFIEKGFYTTWLPQPVHSTLDNLGIVDTQGWYNVVAVNPVVVVIDCRQLGSLPVPKTWADLLQPEYEQLVVLNGCSGDFDDIVLLNIYKQYGDAGIAALRRSVRTGMHPSQMIKSMASNNPGRPPIYVMPYFFANTVSPPIDAKVIWMEDGTLITPLSFLVKTSKVAELQELIAYLTGPEFGRICAGAYFPALHPRVDYQLPDKACLKWLGWDYIRGQDIESLLDRLNMSFIM